MKRDDLIDFLLGESDEPVASEETARYAEAIAILREAATPAPVARVLPLFVRVGAVAAALLLVALGTFLMTRPDAQLRARDFEPDVAFGALLPEEIAPDGSVTPTPTADGYVLRQGKVFVSSLGAEEEHALPIGETILEESELRCGAEGGARIELPKGGQLFLAPLSTVQIRRRPDGRAALRLMSGTAASVAGTEPTHLAIDGTDLLFTQEEGAALLRRTEADAACLRGKLALHLAAGGRWIVPAGECLPAACAHEPESRPMRVEEFDLEWYDQMLGKARRRATVNDGDAVKATATTLLYVRARAAEDTKLTIRYGDGKGRTYDLTGGRTLEIRVPLQSLGNGPAISFEPASAVRAARLFE